jgi:preprotein translocase subunit SecD
MFTDLKWKIPLILFVVLGSAFLAYPLKEKIALGLDLQGGMHLVLEVQTEKAVEASLERIANDIKREIQNEDYEVDRVSADLVNKTGTVLMVDAMDLEPVEKIMKNYTAYMKNEGKVREGRGYKFSLSREEEKRIQQNAVNQGLETIRNRVDQFGVAEPTIQAQGERRILIQLPGIKDADRAIKLNGKTARLDFKMVDESISAETALNGSIPDGDQILYKREENLETGEVTKTPFLVKKRTVLTGETLSGADVRYDTEFNEPYVAITFNSIGAMIFQEVTRENVKKRLASVLDDNVYSAPVIQEEIAGGRAQITGQFTTEEARDLAIILRAGALPAPVIILENRTVGPSLGKDSIEQGVKSMLLGFALVMMFIIIYYKLSGIVAVMALLLNLVLMLGALAYFWGRTHTSGYRWNAAHCRYGHRCECPYI